MSDKLGNDPAYPLEVNYHSGFTNYGDKVYSVENHLGMTRRFYAACAAMQGFLSMGCINPHSIRISDFSEVISQSYEAADELLKQECNDSRGV